MVVAGSPSAVLSVVIVNFNNGKDILPCLEALSTREQGIDFEVVVADNGSTDGSPEEITKRYPKVKQVFLGENRGFGVGCNAGIKESTARTYILLNPDTEVRPYALGRMYEQLRKHSHWGIVGAKMLDGSGRPYRAARRFPTVRDLIFESLALSRLLPKSRLFNGYLYGEREIESLDEVDQVEGSCLMISQAAFERVGLLDERFFVFFEEVDWCLRVQMTGLENHIVQEAVVQHHLSTTMSRNLPRTRRIHATSAMNYFRKHYGERGYNKIRTGMRWALLLKFLLLIPLSPFSFRYRIWLRAAFNELKTYMKGLPA